MTGEATVNLQTGAFTVSLNGLTPLTTYTVWLVDRSESELIPPLPIRAVRTGHLPGVGTHGAPDRRTFLLGLPLGLTIDRVVVTPGLLLGGEHSAQGP